MTKYSSWPTNVEVVNNPDAPNGIEAVITAYSPQTIAQQRAMLQRYLEQQEWDRNHPYLAGIRDFAGNAMSKVGDFVNDEIFLNKDNIRVRNAQRSPDAMQAHWEGGNFAGALIGLPIAALAAAETAPVWGPWALRGLKAAASKKGLAAEGLTTLGLTSRQWLPWLIGGGAAAGTGAYLADNGMPSMSFSSPYSSTSMSYPVDFAKRTNPNDTTGTARDSRQAPVDTTGNASTAQSGGNNTGSSAGNSGNNGDNGNNRSKFSKLLWETEADGKSRFWRYFRNALRTGGYAKLAGLGVDMIGNGIGYVTTPDSMEKYGPQFPALKFTSTPERVIWDVLSRQYTHQNRAVPDSTTNNTTNSTTNRPTQTDSVVTQPIISLTPDGRIVTPSATGTGNDTITPRNWTSGEFIDD